MRPLPFLLAAALLLPIPAGAQPKAKELPGDRVAHDYLRRETAEISKRFLGGAKTLKEWEARRPALREQYLDMLGLWPLPEKTPLKATVTRTLERDGVVIEMVHFQSRPGLYVTGNLYRPKGAKGRLPTILYVCGHSGRGRDGNKTAFQDHGMWFARNGYVCLIVDTLQLGEVKGVHHGTYNLNRWWWHSLAYTPAGVECWNGIRAIDYLLGRPDVDANRLGVTGISGGGAVTIWIAAADERVKCAVPVSGMSDLESYVTNKVINGHCDCMFLVNLYGWEWTTIAALIAPRPLLFANSDNDRIFPMDGNRRIIARLRETYKMYGKPALVDDHVSVGGHDYRKDLRVAIFRWINKHVKGHTGPVADATDKPLPGRQLRVFPEDSDLPKDSINHKVDETFVSRRRPPVPEKGTFGEWKSGLLKELRARPFRALPERVPAARLLKRVSAEEVMPVGGFLGGLRVETEGAFRCYVSDWATRPEGKEGLLVVLNDDEMPLTLPLTPWLRPYAEGRAVRYLRTRGADQRWTKKSPPNYVARAHALLGRTVDTGRVYDVRAALRYLNESEKGKRRWAVAGRGRAGVIAAYAAAFEPSVTDVIAVDPPSSHTEGPHFLGVLRVLDVPDAFGLLAPRPLTLVSKGRAFDRTAEIYRLAGAADRLKRK